MNADVVDTGVVKAGVESADDDNAGTGAAKAPWEPKVVAFVCNWCTYTGADLAGTSRLKQQPNARLIRVPCTGRIDPLFIIKAFESGADGVLVSGCHPADCHYGTGNYHARRRWTLFRSLLEFTGIDATRLHFSWVSASEGRKWVDVVDGVIDEARRQGPFERYHALARPEAMIDD
jgi:F420-non-reducing hydrogenase iron-sulfur subunit